MNARLDTDPELLDLVRRVDPMRDPRVQAGAGLDTESALRLLAPELDRPAPRRADRRRRTALRTAALACLVAATVFVVANVASTGNNSAVSPAQAQTILRHVRDALAWPPHAVYEEETVTTATARDAATHTSGWHEWLSTSPPYNSRSIEFAHGKVLWEQAFVSGRLDLYDAKTDTIYLDPTVPSHDVVGCTQCSGDTPQSNSALSEVQDLLRGQTHDPDAPNVTINRHAVLNGKPAIELTDDHGRFSYWISPSTYQPLQVEDRFFPRITRFPIARVLTGSAASPNLVSLQAQHPHATVDHSRTDYAAAKLRLIGFVSPPPKIVCRQVGPNLRHCAPVPVRQTNGDKH
ncbi:MAG: hypothetical protein WAU75_05745 [Solirubrobacteraceae bacterium]